MARFDGLACALLATFLSILASAGSNVLPLSAAVPIQLSTITDTGVFRVMKDNLFFGPPDSSLYVLKQQWRDSLGGSSTIYSSLQIYNPDTATAPAALVNPRLFLTRTDDAQPQAFSPTNVFGDVSSESRLFRSRCCNCGIQNMAPVTFYWAQDASSSTTGFLTVSKVDNQAEGDLVLSHGTTMEAVLCRLSNLQLQEFPRVRPKLATSMPTPGLRSMSSGKVPVQIIADFGNEKFIFGVRRMSGDHCTLSIYPYKKRPCQTATTFYYRSYDAYHVGLDGQLTSRPSFTLQHANSRQYVVADVLHTVALNTGSNSTGLKLQNDTDFDSETPEVPDYRFFVLYNDLGSNFLGDPLVPRDSANSGRAIHIMCPLYHRRFCLEPAISGEVKVGPVRMSDRRPWPTFADPSSGFAEFLARLECNGTVPRFYFKQMTSQNN